MPPGSLPTSGKFCVSSGEEAVRLFVGRPGVAGATLLCYPTFAFKASMIYNPWFEAKGIDAIVVPLGVRQEEFPGLFRPLLHLTACTARSSRCRIR